MLAAFLKSGPPLDEDSALWLFDAFAWSLNQFSAEFFRDSTVLVLPTNRYFPGRADSVHGMARLVFERAVEYAGMAHWPLALLEPGTCPIPVATPPRLIVNGGVRGDGSVVTLSTGGADGLPVGYDPALVGNPEALIASFAHTLAGLLAASASPPPGGLENLPHATEVAAVFMGFGVMVANSAKTIQVRSCGSCGGGQKGRQSFLSQDDVTYALALFCTLKDIGPREVLPHLEKHLRPFYKKAVKDIEAREEMLASLRKRLQAG